MLSNQLNLKDWKIIPAPKYNNIIWRNFFSNDVVINKIKAAALNVFTFVIAITLAAPVFVLELIKAGSEKKQEDLIDN